MKILMAQCNFIVGNIEANYNKIIDFLTAWNDQYKNYAYNVCDIAVFSELALTGYPPHDLINNARFINDQDFYLKKLIQKSKKMQCAIIIGCITENNKYSGRHYRNSLHVIKNGEIIQTYHKRLLPTYDIFDEDRYFEPGSFPRYVNIAGKNIGLLICEDSWANDSSIYHRNPVNDLMQNQNVDIIISINASPSDIDKITIRTSIVRTICTTYHKPLVYVNQVGANDDIVFDGSSFVMNASGNIIAQLPSFEEASQIVNIKSTKTAKFFILPKEEVMYEHIILGIRDYVQKCGFKKVVVGSSGGIDSALVLAMATEALGNNCVEAITMPSRYSSTGSVDDSVKLCKNLGVKLHNIAIKELYETFFDNFNDRFCKEESLAEQNTQARIRGMILMAFSNRFGNLVLSTGNKSEMAVGYCTLYGDMNGGLAPISDLYKMEVYQLARYFNKINSKKLKYNCNYIIPKAIIDKEPSAELAPDQKDSDNLPPYPVLDTILQHLIENNWHNDHVDFTKIDISTINKVSKMLSKAEYKRRQAPPTIRVHNKAWGAGRRFPIAQQFN